MITKITPTEGNGLFWIADRHEPETHLGAGWYIGDDQYDDNVDGPYDTEAEAQAAYVLNTVAFEASQESYGAKTERTILLTQKHGLTVSVDNIGRHYWEYAGIERGPFLSVQQTVEDYSATQERIEANYGQKREAETRMDITTCAFRITDERTRNLIVAMLLRVDCIFSVAPVRGGWTIRHDDRYADESTLIRENN